MAFLPQMHNTEVITKLLIISNMVFDKQCPVNHECWHGGDCCYIYTYSTRSHCAFVVFFGLAQTHELSRAAHTLATPLEWMTVQLICVA